MTDCIFCKIINGDFGTEFVYENESAVVFKDINPQADTHLLVVPRLHVESLNELNDKNLFLPVAQLDTRKTTAFCLQNLAFTWVSAHSRLMHINLRTLSAR